MPDAFSIRPRRASAPWFLALFAAGSWLLLAPDGPDQVGAVTQQAPQTQQKPATPLTEEELAEQEEREYELAMGRQTFEQNCLICHAVEMVSGQRLTPTQWQAEVEKMVGWGAPVPPEEVDRLVDFLQTSYPADLPPAPLARLKSPLALKLHQPDPDALVLPEGNAERGAALHVEHCATCHGANARGAELGPNLVERPVLRREPEFTEIVRDGRRRMPGFGLVLSLQQEADILAWLKGQRYEAFAE